MCQLNIYMIDKKVTSDNVLRIFRSHGVNLVIEKVYNIDGFQDSHNLYSTLSRCDCGSVISSLQHQDFENIPKLKRHNHNKQFKQINNILSDLTVYTNELAILPIWQDKRIDLRVSSINEKYKENMTLHDLCTHKYDELLVIK